MLLLVCIQHCTSAGSIESETGADSTQSADSNSFIDSASSTDGGVASSDSGHAGEPSSDGSAGGRDDVWTTIGSNLCAEFPCCEGDRTCSVFRFPDERGKRSWPPYRFEEILPSVAGEVLVIEPRTSAVFEPTTYLVEEVNDLSRNPNAPMGGCTSASVACGVCKQATSSATLSRADGTTITVALSVDPEVLGKALLGQVVHVSLEAAGEALIIASEETSELLLLVVATRGEYDIADLPDGWSASAGASECVIGPDSCLHVVELVELVLGTESGAPVVLPTGGTAEIEGPASTYGVHFSRWVRQADDAEESLEDLPCSDSIYDLVDFHIVRL